MKTKTLEGVELDSFKTEYLCKFPLDPDFDYYYGVWLIYHRAADAVDGHLPYNAGGGRAGHAEVLDATGIVLSAHCPNPKLRPELYKKWQRAKLESLHTVEMERSGKIECGYGQKTKRN